MTAAAWQSLYPNMPRNVSRWFATAEDGQTAPHFVERWLETVRRGEQVHEAAAVPLLANARELCVEEIRERCPDMERRRRAETKLAYRMSRLPGLHNRHVEGKDGKLHLRPHVIREQAEKMFFCRQHGFLYRQDGESRIAWSDKCGSLRLCPDESRAETKRLICKYVPAIEQWAAVKPWRDVHYCVFTYPNIPRGRLLEGKRHLMDRTKAFIRMLIDDGLAAGALVVQEDPLGKSPGFNVHQNVILLVEGWLDYKMIRDTWGFNVHLQRVDPSAKALTKSLFELVKYSAKHVSDEDTEAPADGWLFPEFKKSLPLVEWDDAALIEWLSVQLGDHGARRRAPFRRVRSYGVLYRLDALRWRDADYRKRVEWASAAVAFDQPLRVGVASRHVARCLSWYQLDRRFGLGTRESIRHVWDALDGESGPSQRNPTWLAEIRMTAGGEYWVGSIQGNNFFSPGGVTSGPGATGPPFS